jgi:hypothetical protein
MGPSDTTRRGRSKAKTRREAYIANGSSMERSQTQNEADGRTRTAVLLQVSLRTGRNEQGLQRARRVILHFAPRAHFVVEGLGFSLDVWGTPKPEEPERRPRTFRSTNRVEE